MRGPGTWQLQDGRWPSDYAPTPLLVPSSHLEAAAPGLCGATSSAAVTSGPCGAALPPLLSARRSSLLTCAACSSRASQASSSGTPE